MQLTRRDLAKYTLTGAGAMMLGCATRLPLIPAVPPIVYPDLPAPASSGIEHIVVVTMENRSFDHILGWLPNGDGKQAGLSFTDSGGAMHTTHPLSGDFTGCPHPDPDHSYAASRVAYDNGKNDGFLRAGSNDVFAIGYYEEKDVPFYAALARNYTACDRYFAAILAPTFPNRVFLYAAQTDRLSDSIAISSLPTIFDRLAVANVSHNYYFSNVPFLALWGVKYLGISKLHDEFLDQAKKGTIPAVSFVDPRYTVLDDGTGDDDHPHADIREGESFLHDLFEAVANGPAWSSTVIVFNFDEWGGFFEHIPPPRAQAANKIDTDVVNGKTLLGFRVGTVVASPFSRGNPQNPRVSSVVFDHTSVLKLIEWRWGLSPLTPRDASSDVKNLAYALNFKAPRTEVPALPKPDPPAIVAPCLANLIGDLAKTQAAPEVSAPPPKETADETAMFKQLKQQATASGFKMK